MHYIGMDCHITTLDFAVVNDAGRLVKASSVATSVNGFMEFVKNGAATTDHLYGGRHAWPPGHWKPASALERSL